MSEAQQDTFFFTKQNFDENPAVHSTRNMSNSLSKPIQGRKQELQQLYNNYNLFKYSKCFMPKRRLSVRQAAKTDRDNDIHNFKSIKRQSQKLKQRLTQMEQQRKLLLEKLRVHNK